MRRRGKGSPQGGKTKPSEISPKSYVGTKTSLESESLVFKSGIIHYSSALYIWLIEGGDTDVP